MGNQHRLCLFLCAVILLVGIASCAQVSIAPEQKTPEKNWQGDDYGNSAGNSGAYNPLDEIRSQLQTAKKSGGITPQAYAEIDAKIKIFEGQDYNKSLTDELRSLLSQLIVGGQSPGNENGNDRSVKSEAEQKDGNNMPWNGASLKSNASSSEEKIASPIPRVVTWYNVEDGTWIPRGSPPECKDPIVFQAPVDLKLVTSILYPGQVRGGDFKPHGGFRTDRTTKPVEVKAPRGGYIWNAAKFYDEFGVHYMFDIQDPCGIMYRLGHLGAVPEKLEAIFDNQPEKEFGDSRTFELAEPVFVELGETIALDTQHGSGFDWGVYDLRKENQAAQDSDFRQAHKDEASQAYYAICWFDYLPSDQEAIVRSLPAADGKSGKNSDYC